MGVKFHKFKNIFENAIFKKEKKEQEPLIILLLYLKGEPKTSIIDPSKSIKNRPLSLSLSPHIQTPKMANQLHSPPSFFIPLRTIFSSSFSFFFSRSLPPIACWVMSWQSQLLLLFSLSAFSSFFLALLSISFRYFFHSHLYIHYLFFLFLFLLCILGCLDSWVWFIFYGS